MKKLKNFFDDIKKYGLRYALCWLFNLPYLFEQSNHSKLRKFSDKCYDWCYEKYDRAQHSVDDVEEWKLSEDRTVTPCGCTMFDCTGCSSYAVCNHD